jgi:hypothetical protein
MSITHTFAGSNSLKGGYGYYAFIENGELVIGENWPREGGETYRGTFANASRAMRTLEKEAPRLYSSIIKYYTEKPEEIGKIITPEIKTFKDKLTERADSYEINIANYVEEIKEKMQDNFNLRKFKLCLIDSKPNSLVVSGYEGPDTFSLFVPKSVSPETYQKLFINAFRELGFEDKDMSLATQEFKDYKFYYIHLRW